MGLSKKTSASYVLVPQLESNQQDAPVHNPASRSIIKACLLLISYLMVASSAYFVASGGSFHHTTLHTSSVLELELSPTTFHYNRSFSYPPSNHTNKAWRDMFPIKGGFFTHPTIAPNSSSFSVFHQLHCLDALRGAYWTNQRAAVEGRILTDKDLPVDMRPAHMRHCIDYLRQNLMCQADTTLEVVEESTGGINGFGTVHTCRNWEQLKAWTNEQQLRFEVQSTE